MGAFNTLALVILTGFVGAYLARMQGYEVMLRVRSQIQQGMMPAEELIDAMIIFAAGVVLLTPGLLTDIAGLLLLYPTSRFHFKRWLRKKFDQWIQDPNITIRYYNPK